MKCIAVRSTTHGKWAYKEAYVYEAVDGRWKKGEFLFEVSYRTDKKLQRMLGEHSAKLGIPVKRVSHNQAVELVDGI
jgi:hypothetical protein